jgi:hypothetical protein
MSMNTAVAFAGCIRRRLIASLRSQRRLIKQKKPRGFPRGFFGLTCREEDCEAFRSLQTWQRPTLPSLET